MAIAFENISTQSTGTYLDPVTGISTEDIIIESLTEGDAPVIRDLIRRNLQEYEEAGTVLAATFRRLEALFDTYSGEGAKFFVAKDTSRNGQIIGAAGLGTFHGLPISEGLGEVRDLVLEPIYRGRGLGTRLLKRCLDEAKRAGYKRIYLETTPQMEPAKKLFLRFGFRPITQGTAADSASGSAAGSNMACYFLLENLESPT